MNNNSNSIVEGGGDYEKIQVTLTLDKNIAEVLRILAICYSSDCNTEKNDLLNQFLSQEVTKITKALAVNPPEPPTFPQSLRDLLKTKVSNESNNQDKSLTNSSSSKTKENKEKNGLDK